MNFEGADKIEIDENNSLMINIQNQTFSILRPKIYQEIDGDNGEIENECIIEKNKVSFKVNKDSKLKILSINPSVLYGTYIGGVFYDEGYGVAVYENGIAYITGYTNSSNFPITTSAYQNTLKGISDVFLVKLDTKLNGVSSLLYGTYIGGNGNDWSNGIAIDEKENAYQINKNNGYDIFMIKMNTRIESSDLTLKKRVYKCEECVENNIPYVIEVINVGPDEATNIIVTDIIQMGLVINFIDLDIGIIENVGNTVTWAIEKLEVGQKGVAVIDVAITNVLFYKINENVINTATLTADVNLVNPENSTDTVVTCTKNKRGKTIVTHRF